MSTNAVIMVQGLDMVFYKHWDGYPEGTLPWLEKFNKYFTENRGYDPMYKFAQLIRSSYTMQEEFDLDPSVVTGWGVAKDIKDVSYDYLYILMEDGTVMYK